MEKGERPREKAVEGASSNASRWNRSDAPYILMPLLLLAISVSQSFPDDALFSLCAGALSIVLAVLCLPVLWRMILVPFQVLHEQYRTNTFDLLLLFRRAYQVFVPFFSRHPRFRSVYAAAFILCAVAGVLPFLLDFGGALIEFGRDFLKR